MTDLFNEKYKKIIDPIHQELNNFNSYFEDYLSQKSKKVQNEQTKNEIIPIIKEFLNNKGKQIRPVLMFLLLKALNIPFQEQHYKLAIINELIHNATLIHDDIIDCSLLRRGKKTLNFEYDSKLAVLAGDYLLTDVIQLLLEIENAQIRDIYSSAVSKIVNGELHQYFNRFKALSPEEYIEKSKNKTARLFEAGLCGVYLYNNESPKNLEQIREFALNFGIAFQIHNDLKNINNTQKLCEDIENGDYSIPVIYYLQENPENKKPDINKIKNSNALEKAKNLVKYYTDKAIENISFIEDNCFKQALIELCNLHANG